METRFIYVEYKDSTLVLYFCAFEVKRLFCLPVPFLVIPYVIETIVVVIKS